MKIKQSFFIFGNNLFEKGMVKSHGPLSKDLCLCEEYGSNYWFWNPSWPESKQYFENILYQLKKLSKLNNILSNKDFKTVIHTFISMQLNYCNALG